jgi:hypothetical protein
VKLKLSTLIRTAVKLAPVVLPLVPVVKQVLAEEKARQKPRA